MKACSFRLLLLLFGFTVLHGACNSTESVRTLKLAHGLDPGHSVHLGMVYMAERLEEKSGGKLTIDIYPSQQLGSERQCLELLQIGSLAMTKVSAAVMEGFAPSYRVLSLPYIFKNKEHSYRVLDGEVGKEILESGTDFWLRGLTFYDAGSRSFYTKDRPIMKPEDLAGLKIRVMQSPTAVNMIKAMGGSPTPISWGELYTALQGGVVDGAENNPPSFYLSHHYEVCKYYCINEHTSVPDVLLISTIIWKQLNKTEQEWLSEAARESALYQRDLWAKSEEEALEAVKEAGVEIIYPAKQPFIEKVSSLYIDYNEDPVLSKLITRIKLLEGSESAITGTNDQKIN
ncbi:MAG: TRAP transporter substrate-binding protein [Marinilabiliaceae bacterium]|nr:TRAP transporter substrate-binding protein [Marinilabiliaceae bacterium]